MLRVGFAQGVEALVDRREVLGPVGLDVLAAELGREAHGLLELAHARPRVGPDRLAPRRELPHRRGALRHTAR